MKVSTLSELQNLIATNKLVIVKFGTQWCGPCKMAEPVFKKMADEISTAVFISVDLDDIEEVTDTYAITGVPLFIIFQNGKVAKRQTGADMGKLRRDILNLV